MSTFWNVTTFNYTLGNLVQFRVAAYNVNGWGESSTPNTNGALVLTAPSFMNSP